MMQLKLSLSHGAKVALAVVAVFLLAEVRAWASCSDHTVFSFASFANDSPPSGVRGGQLPTRSGARTSSPSAPCGSCPVRPFESPCRGLGCSGNNLPDGLPITSDKTDVTQDQWNVVLADDRLNANEQIGWLALSQMPSPISRTDSIFHPPRHY